MAENTIEIEVELVGQDKALDGLNEVKDGAEGIGETFKGVGDIIGKTNEQLGESLGAVSEAVGSGVEAFQGMRDAMGEVAAGTAGISALVGPIGLLTVAIGGAYEAYRQFSGAAQEAKDQQEAMAAASADLMSKLEELAEKGIGYAKNQLLDYAQANLRAQLMKEILEKRTERSLKTLRGEAEALKEARKAALKYGQVLKDQSSSYQERRIAEEKMNEALSTQRKAVGQTQAVFSSLADEMIRVNDELDAAAKQFKKLEKQTDEGLETQAKENIAKIASIKALKAEVEAETEAAKLTALRQAEREKTIALAALENLERHQLKALVDAQKVALKALNEEGLKDKKLAQDIIKLNKDKTKSRAKETKAIDQQKLAQQALREEQMRLVKESQLRQLDIKLTEEGYQQQIALEAERYQLGLALAQDNALQREIVERQHDLALKSIEDQRLKRTQDLYNKQLSFFMQMYQEMNQAYERQLQKQKRAQAQELKMYQDFFSQYGKGLAQAAVANVLFGDSFKDSAAAVLKSLAIEAGARSLMELAAGTGALALGLPTAAAHFKASGIFAAAAGAAKAGSSLLGAEAGGGATGGATASPTGAPQVATTPQREEAQSREMTFNLNFGGAVIYDTKEAAKRAMIGDLVRTYNGNNRGMPRFNFAR
jgi:hypothetical protein